MKIVAETSATKKEINKVLNKLVGSIKSSLRIIEIMLAWITTPNISGTSPECVC